MRDIVRKHLVDIHYGVKQRTTNASHPKYKDYGARGIKMCSEWLNSFAAFYEWAIANGYEIGLTLDRIDNNGNYEPSNCRWATHDVQNNNSRHNVYITYNGETHTLKQWANILNIKYDTLKFRIRRAKWSIEKAFTTPVKND